MPGKTNIQQYGKLAAANYLVNSYADLKDVVETIEGIIKAGARAGQQAMVRKVCRVKVIPLNNEDGSHILRILLPQGIFGRLGATTKQPADKNS